MFLPLFKKTIDDDTWKAFNTYLISFEGGSVKPGQANRHKLQAQYLLGLTNKELTRCATDISEAINDKLKRGEWQANTARTYTGSLALLIKFIQRMAGMGQTKYKLYAPEGLQSLLQRMGNWSKSLMKLSQSHQKNKTRSLTASDIVNPDDIKKYLECTRAKKAVSDLQNVNSSTIVTQEMHTRCRNQLLFRLAMANAHRSGCLTNLILKEFTDGLKHERSDHYIVHVNKHKTSLIHGAAEVIITKELYRMMNTYIRYIRPVSSAEEVFINWSGTILSAGDIAKAFSMELAHAGVEKRFVCMFLMSSL
jgi:hypothetical protein